MNGNYPIDCKDSVIFILQNASLLELTLEAVIIHLIHIHKSFLFLNLLLKLFQTTDFSYTKLDMCFLLNETPIKKHVHPR